MYPINNNDNIINDNKVIISYYLVIYLNLKCLCLV